jgi:hypothetical protein
VYGVNRRLVAFLRAVSLMVLVLLEFSTLFQGPSLGGTQFLLYPLEVVSVAIVLLLLRAHWEEVLKGLLPGLGSAVLVIFAYGFGRQDIPFTLWGPYFPSDPPDPAAACGLVVLLCGTVLARSSLESPCASCQAGTGHAPFSSGARNLVGGASSARACWEACDTPGPADKELEQ